MSLPVGRLAPSPTGHLHVGHARTFLLAWWHARARGGRVVLRIEDLDRDRSKRELVDACLRDLEWLGLDWDGRETFQSADTRAMERALEHLVREGHAYPCICSRRDILAVQSAPHGREGELRYPGTCRARFASLEEAQAAADGPVGWRFAVPSGPVEIEDGLAGAYAADVQEEVGDFLVARRDGVWSYQLAVVADDARQGVTEVVRGDDLLPSTPRQLLLQRALQLPHPSWFHVPLVVDPNGRRLSKRELGHTLAALREGGVDPRRVVEWVAESAGHPDPEPAEAADYVEGFRLEGIPRDPVVFGPVELARLTAPRPPTRPGRGTS